MLSQSEENYLKAIFLLGNQNNRKISITALASVLGHNPASVTDMLKRLKDKKLVDYDKTKGAELDGYGKEIAVDIVRKHRLWEMFLQEKLGYTWDEVHDLAEQLEHVQDSNLASRLDMFLGHPQYDPHGEPIPSPEGNLPKISVKTLQQLNVMETGRVVSVKDTSRTFLQYLGKLHIGIGTLIKIVEIIEFDGSLVILIDEAEKSTISEKFAENVLVNFK